MLVKYKNKQNSNIPLSTLLKTELLSKSTQLRGICQGGRGEREKQNFDNKFDGSFRD